MARERTGQGRAKRPRQKKDNHQTEPAAASSTTLHAARSGQWMEAESMRRWAIEQLQQPPEATRELVIDLTGIGHLDASALQVLLAMGAEQRKREGVLRLAHASEGLRRWFGYAGAEGLLDQGDGGSAAMEGSEACAKF
jgi:anti-anti-sigma factor